MPAAPRRAHREVVSYVRRSSRMNDGQRRAWDAHASRFVVGVPAHDLATSIAPDAHVDWGSEFGRDAPLIVEIGPGAGETLASVAAARPESDFVAFEVYQPAVASLLARVARAGLTNVRVVLANGVEGLDHLIAPGALAELWTFFPDPWHKARHHKRRLVSAALADLVASRLVEGGRWRLATDWPDYAEWMRATLDPDPALRNVHDGWAPRWADRPLTRYESRGLAAGRPVHDLAYERRPRVDGS